MHAAGIKKVAKSVAARKMPELLLRANCFYVRLMTLITGSLGSFSEMS